MLPFYGYIFSGFTANLQSCFFANRLPEVMGKQYICRMKLLCTILAFLVMTLSVQPVCIAESTSDTCCTGNNCAEENEKDDSENDPKDCTSGCNPFQICGCCAFSVVVPSPILLTAPSPVAASNHQWGIISVGINEDMALSFWQPPRLS